MTEIMLAISSWCSMSAHNGLTGYYSVEMEKKMNCQLKIAKCLNATVIPRSKGNLDASIFSKDLLSCLIEIRSTKAGGSDGA